MRFVNYSVDGEVSRAQRQWSQAATAHEVAARKTAELATAAAVQDVSRPHRCDGAVLVFSSQLDFS